MDITPLDDDTAPARGGKGKGKGFAPHMVVTPSLLTDSSGGSASATAIALVTAPTALTDNGGGTADATVAAMTAPGALTVTDGAGSVDGTIDAITNNASTITAVQELAAKANLANTMLGVVKDNVKELTTQQDLNRLAIVALTNNVATLSAKVNAILAALKGR